MLFQSTHPVRGATVILTGRELRRGISIHAPREGCDVALPVLRPSALQFQSTHPVRGATAHGSPVYAPMGISIHAPREGCDIASRRSTGTPTKFQSTHPVRGATRRNRITAIKNGISIHAPREGCDRKNGLHISKYGYSTHSTASIVPYDSPAFSPICESAESICQQITHS